MISMLKPLKSLREADVSLVYTNYEDFKKKEMIIPLEAWLALEEARQDKMRQVDLATSRQLNTTECFQTLPDFQQSFGFYLDRLEQYIHQHVIVVYNELRRPQSAHQSEVSISSANQCPP